MTTKLFLATGALALAGLSTAYGGSFEIWFGTPVEAGGTILQPGPYSVSQDGSDAARFKNLNTGNVYVTPATIEHLDHKNQMIHVKMTNENGQKEIQSIALGGKATDLEFGG